MSADGRLRQFPPLSDLPKSLLKQSSGKDFSCACMPKGKVVKGNRNG